MIKNIFSNNEVIIFEKEDNYGVLVIDHMTDNDVIGSYSAKNNSISRNAFFNTAEADEAYHTAVVDSLENQWTLIYVGERNWG